MTVMAGLVPAIHAFSDLTAAKTWMPATSAGMTVVHPHCFGARTCTTGEMPLNCAFCSSVSAP